MLSFLIFLPLFFGASLFVSPKSHLQMRSLILGGVYFLITCSLFFLFNTNTHHLQLTQQASFIPFLGVEYFLAIDGLSFWYILLSAFLLPLTVLCSWKQNSPVYFFLLFLLVSFSVGTFLSFDAILFYLFFEMSLLPLFFLIYLWGGKERIYAAFKFLIYTFFASLFLLGGIITLMLMSESSFGELSSNLLNFYKLDLVFIEGDFLSAQNLLFLCFAFAFAVKTPLFPFHTWLPLAHVEAPTGASVYLAAVMLKMGTYGWFRFVLPLFPEASSHYATLFLLVAVFSLIYSSLVAFAQKDMKKLIAYSSVAHMAYVLIGLFAFNIYGVTGAFYQTLTHGISSAGLFLLVGLLYERTKSRQISDYGGLAKTMPWFAISFFIITLSSIALPLTGGFVSEFLVLLGSYLSGEIWVWFAVLGVVLSAIYMLRLFQKVFLSEASSLSKGLKDLNLREICFLTPLTILVFLMGVFPNIFLNYSSSSLEHLNNNRYNYTLPTHKHQNSKASSFKKRIVEEEKLLKPKIDFDALFIPDSLTALKKREDHLKYYRIKKIHLLGTNLWSKKQISKLGSKNILNTMIFKEDF